MSQSRVPEGVVKFAHALVEAPHLRLWFYSLEKLSDDLRKSAFIEMACRMRDGREDIDLTEAVNALARPKMYETVLAAVRERVDEVNRPA